MAKRQCPFCGKYVPESFTQCVYCREPLPPVPAFQPNRILAAKRNIRQGILYMVLAGVIEYFAGGHSSIAIPFEVPPEVSKYGVPFLFLGGLGLTLFGLYRRFTR